MVNILKSALVGNNYKQVEESLKPMTPQVFQREEFIVVYYINDDMSFTVLKIM